MEIKINIKDNKYYADVAFLLDRGDFLSDLKMLRKKWNLDKKLLPYTNVNKTFPPTNAGLINASGKVGISLEKKLSNLYYMDTLSLEEREKLLLDWKKSLRIDPSWDFYFDIKDLRNKYHRPYNFDRIIETALLHGIVENGDYITCELTILRHENEFLQYFEDEEIAIKFSPLSKMSDIRKVVTENIKGIRASYEKTVLGGKLFNVYKKTEIIRMHRKWYWLNIDGLSYEKIYTLESSLENGVKVEPDAIAKAIQRYRDILSIPL